MKGYSIYLLSSVFALYQCVNPIEKKEIRNTEIQSEYVVRKVMVLDTLRINSEINKSKIVKLFHSELAIENSDSILNIKQISKFRLASNNYAIIYCIALKERNFSSQKLNYHLVYNIDRNEAHLLLIDEILLNKDLNYLNPILIHGIERIRHFGYLKCYFYDSLEAKFICKLNSMTDRVFFPFAQYSNECCRINQNNTMKIRSEERDSVKILIIEGKISCFCKKHELYPLKSRLIPTDTFKFTIHFKFIDSKIILKDSINYYRFLKSLDMN